MGYYFEKLINKILGRIIYCLDPFYAIDNTTIDGVTFKSNQKLSFKQLKFVEVNIARGACNAPFAKCCGDTTFDMELYTNPLRYIQRLQSRTRLLNHEVNQLHDEVKEFENKDYFDPIAKIVTASLEELRQMSKIKLEDEHGENSLIVNNEDGTFGVFSAFCTVGGHEVYTNFGDEKTALTTALVMDALDHKIPTTVCKDCYEEYYV